MRKSYLELTKLTTFEERLEYLRTNNDVGATTFGGHRQLNQTLYSSQEWKSVRRRVVIRDEGNDMGMPGYPIVGSVFVHHINPITPEDILKRNPNVFDLNNLVSVSFDTHNSIHYSTVTMTTQHPERKPNDTCPWRR